MATLIAANMSSADRAGLTPAKLAFLAVPEPISQARQPQNPLGPATPSGR
ncbi:MAG: hypothetical protein WBD53_18630 [Xanthobacteraceae bacterium]